MKDTIKAREAFNFCFPLNLHYLSVNGDIETHLQIGTSTKITWSFSTKLNLITYKGIANIQV